MGSSMSTFLTILPSLWLSFSFFFLLFLTNVSLLTAASSGTATIIAPPPQQPLFKSKGSPFRPSIAVIVGVLTTVFSVTFLLLLYAKHCRRGDNSNPFSLRGYPPTVARKNSGIDRTVIESLPIFRFASLRGQKDGLECAVCLNKFEGTEVLRLLPKCKHAFHVECVDTWLDAHSTCPLCRYRVDPEDILLVEDNRILYRSQSDGTPTRSSSSVNLNHPTPDLSTVSRVSGRHSFAGNSLEVIVETPKGGDGTSFVPRRSLDSWSSRKKRNTEIVGGVGCLDRPRKDELLLADKTGKGKDVIAEERRLEHRIIISGGTDIETDGSGSGSGAGPNQRWSDVQPSDLLFLRSEMFLTDSRRFSTSRGSRPSISNGEGSSSSRSHSNNNRNSRINGGEGEINNNNNNYYYYYNGVSGRNVINERSVSEITGMSRFINNDKQQEEEEEEHEQQERRRRQQQQQRRSSGRRKERQEEHRKRQEGAVKRWLAWMSQTQKSENQQNQSQPQPQTQTAVHETSTTTSPSSSIIINV